MRIEIDLRERPAAARLLRAEDFGDLRVVLVGSDAPLAPRLAPAGVVRFDEHAWIRVSAIRELAGAAATDEWERSLRRMVDYARSHGWFDEELGAVRAHCERRLPDADDSAGAAQRPGMREQEAIPPDRFREVIGHFASGVAVITAQRDGTHYGMTASAVASLSLEPPMLLVCVNRESVTHGIIEEAGAFGVNVLTTDQGEIAKRFAGTDRAGKFGGLRVHHGPLQAPLLSDALACLECKVAETVVGGTHTVFLGIVQDAEAAHGEPLTYFRGRFGRFIDANETVPR